MPSAIFTASGNGDLTVVWMAVLSKMTNNYEPRTEQIGGKLPKVLNSRFRDAARRMGISLNEAIMQAIEMWLDNLES
jgi:hypothetical protein